MNKTIKAAAWGNHREGYNGVLIEVTEKVVRQCHHRHKDTAEARECIRYNNLEPGLPETVDEIERLVRGGEGGN